MDYQLSVVKTRVHEISWLIRVEAAELKVLINNKVTYWNSDYVWSKYLKHLI